MKKFSHIEQPTIPPMPPVKPISKDKIHAIINGKPYTSKGLLKIGNNVASLWGGNCFDFQVLDSVKEVVFTCSEAGEYFNTSIKYDDLVKYDY